MDQSRDVRFTILSLAVLALIAVPVGVAVFWLGFVHGDSPCVMCWEQRVGMVLIALAGVFILRYGPRPKYIALALLVGAWGIHMGLRHTGMHAARDVGQGFSIEIFGAHTYVWSLLIYWVAVVTMGLLLMTVRASDLSAAPRGFGRLQRITVIVFLVVVAANLVQAFASTGPPPFMGQGDPIRFSFVPRHWVWSLEEYHALPVSLRGRWAIEKPAIDGLSADPAAGPLAGLTALEVRGERVLSLPLRGTVTDLAFDEATGRFLVTTQHGVYLTDGDLGRVVRHTVVDPGYSVDLGRFAGSAFLDSRTVMAVGENKSYVVLRESDEADAEANFRYFLESFDRFDEVSRSRLGTVRARMMYAMAASFDPIGQAVYTVTVPNAKVKRMVVSRFDRRDLTLSEEFVPSVAPESGLALAGEKRSLDEYYVTGAAIRSGRMYAVSAAHSTLLVIDLAARAVTAAHVLPGVTRPVGVALKAEEVYVVNGEGRVVVYGLRQ